MNKRYVVRLSEEERVQLREIVRKGRASAQKIARANVLLKVDADGENWRDHEAAKAFGLSENAVAKIRARYVERGLDAALDRKRQELPSRKPKLDGADQARVIAVACGDPPEGRARWTLRLLAGRIVELELAESISHETVRQILKKTN